MDVVHATADSLRCCTQCLAIYRADFARCPTDGAPLEIRSEDPLIGATIGEHYVVDGFLGEGGMGRVYRAHHTRLQRRQFAIKVLLGDLAATIATRMRFAQEADAASRLDHPNVVPVVDFGKTATGLMYLAMELVTGRTLAQVIEEEAPLAPERVIALARQMCLGLGHAHGRDLVHRDFKPDNVLVVEAPGGEVPRILDFGLAITYDDEPSARLTTAGLVLGTPTYAAPEQTHGEAVDVRADLFALGVTMYEMLSGKTPHDGTAFEVVRLNARAAPPPIASRANVQVPPALEALVARLLRRDPAERYASATDVIAALDGLSAVPAVADAGDTMTVPAMRDEPVAEVARPAPRRGRALFAIAAATLAIAGIAAVFVLRGGGDASAPAPSAPPPSAPVPRPVTPPVAVPSPAAAPVAAAPSAPSAPSPPPEPTPAPVTSDRTTSAPTRITQPTARPKKVVATRDGTAPKPDVIPPEPPTPDPTPAPAEAAPVLTPPAVPAEPAPPVSAPPSPPPPAPPVQARPRTLLAASALTQLGSRGSLPAIAVRRAVERVLPEINECARRAAVTTSAASEVVKATFIIDDSRRASSIAIAGAPPAALAGCVTRALAGVRTADPPDVGAVTVVVGITFTGGP